MGKYRKKPVVIDAFLLAESSEPAPWFFKACVNGNVIVERNSMTEHRERLRCKIKTLEGVMTVQEGDYIIRGVNGEIYPCKADIFEKTYEAVTDDAIVNGVTVQKSSCPYCCDDGEGAHGRLKHSYDDEDGMAMSIHPSPKRKEGTRSLAWWATVHFRGECRDFYIEVCPFCGRRLVPLREEYDCSPEPPKECE